MLLYLHIFLRLSLNDFLAGQVVENGDLLRELCKSKASLYKQIDGTFKVELAFVEMITGLYSKV